jgi:leucine-rich melanocyte differentiation-associated protein
MSLDFTLSVVREHKDESLTIKDDNDGGEEERQDIVQVLGDGQHISVVSAGWAELPDAFLQAHASPRVTELDLSGNKFSSVSGRQFDVFSRTLKRLVLDDNELGEHGFNDMPEMQELETLWLNGNRIEDVEPLLDRLAICAPKLRWLSLLKNPACPNFFVGKDDDDYQRYRYFVLHRLPELKYIDATPVGAHELAEAERAGRFMKVARVDKAPAASPRAKGKGKGKSKSRRDSSSNNDNSHEDDDDDDEHLDEDEDHLEASGLSALPTGIAKPGARSASFGFSRFVYVGRESEGNRFVRDVDL